jgi:hypothetical protein
MACFNLAWIENICIWIVVAVACWSVIKLLLPYLTGVPLVAQIIEIILWAVVAIIVIIVIFALLECIFSGGGISGLLPHGR